MIGRRYLRFYPGEGRDLLRWWRHPETVTGETARFEGAVAELTGRRHAVAVCSGRQGLELLLAAYGLKPGDEVIFPAYTLGELPMLVSARGLVPVGAEIDPLTFNLDPSATAAALTLRTRAIIATHLFGSPCDLAALRTLANRRDVLLIEDAAHALGSSCQGRPAGSVGDAAFFSFELTKPVNTFGGGMVVTDDDRVAARLREAVARLPGPGSRLRGRMLGAWLQRWLLPTPIFWPLAWAFYWPATARLINDRYRAGQRRGRVTAAAYTDLQAAVGRRQLSALGGRDERRRAVAAELRRRLDPRIAVQQILPGCVTNYYFFVVCFPGTTTAWRARQHFLQCGIDVGIGAEIADAVPARPASPPPPAAARMFTAAVHLPLHEALTARDVDRLAMACNSWCAVVAGGASR